MSPQPSSSLEFALRYLTGEHDEAVARRRVTAEVRLDELRRVMLAAASNASPTEEAIASERRRQIAAGYTPEHDDQHGIDHLLRWSEIYASRGQHLESRALVRAARELIDRARRIRPTLEQIGPDTCEAPNPVTRDLVRAVWKTYVERNLPGIHVTVAGDPQPRILTPTPDERDDLETLLRAVYVALPATESEPTP